MDGDYGRTTQMNMRFAVVVERQTHYLEGVAPKRRGGSNPPDRIAARTKSFKPKWHKGSRLFLLCAKVGDCWA